jgi:RNA polymerase sigma factor (sigma-70 family)
VADQEWLAEQFQAHRGGLRAVAYRMLGSLSEADDAVQETWLRLTRSDPGEIANLGGWLTAVTGRVCLDMLRTRKARREEPLNAAGLPGWSEEPLDVAGPLGCRERPGPEEEALLADSVGLALLLVLDRLTPAERLAFVLHDSFNVPFDEIAAILGRSVDATKMLASRARRRLRQASAERLVPDSRHRTSAEQPATEYHSPRQDADPARSRALVAAFLAAARLGDFDALLSVLDPDVVVRADAAAAPSGLPTEVRGATAVARQALLFATPAANSRVATVNGAPAVVVAVDNRIVTILTFAIHNARIAAIEVLADPHRLATLDVVESTDNSQTPGS